MGDCVGTHYSTQAVPLAVVVNYSHGERRARQIAQAGVDVRLLANLSRFVIVDITNPRSTPLELAEVVPDYMVPFAPIL